MDGKGAPNSKPAIEPELSGDVEGEIQGRNIDDSCFERVWKK